MIPCLCDLSTFKSNIISKDNGKHTSDNEDKYNYRLSADNNFSIKINNVQCILGIDFKK